MASKYTGIALSYVNTFINMIISLFLSSFFVKQLGDLDYGVYQTVSSFANYLVLLEFGAGTIMTRNVSLCAGDKEKVQKNVSTVWGLTAFLSSIILAVSVVFYFLIDVVYANSMTAEQCAYGQRMFIFITVYLIASFYIQTLNGLVLAYEKYNYASIQNIVRLIIRTAVIVLIVCAAYKHAIVIAVVDAVITVGLLIAEALYITQKLKIRLSWKYFDKTVMREAFPLGIAIFLQAIINQSNNNVDKFVIGISMTPADVTVYSIGLFVFNMFSSITNVPITMFAPQIVRFMKNNESREELTKELFTPCRLIAVIGGCIFFGFIVAGRQFVSVFYGDKYLVAWLVAIILMFATYFNMITGPIVNVLNVLNKRIVRSLLLMITTVLNIILTVVWVINWGIVGASVATLIATLLGQVVILSIYYQKVLKINVLRIYLESFKGTIWCFLAATAASWGVSLLISNSLVSLICTVAVFMAVFFLCFLLFGANETEKKGIRSVLRRLKIKV